jgi:hypothetical protein
MKSWVEVRWITFSAYGNPRNHVRRFDDTVNPYESAESQAWDFRNAEVNKHPEAQDNETTRYRIVRVTEQEVA